MTPPKYLDIAGKLRDRILSGELKPGDRLPTHEALTQEFGTTGMTIRKALAELELEQLVQTRPTVGTFVRNLQRHRLPLGDGSLTAFTPTFPVLNDRLLNAIAGPDRQLSQTMTVSRVVPPQGIADRLRTGGARAVLHHRVFYVGEDRISLSNTYFPERAVSGSAIEQPVMPDVRAFETLEELGLRIEELEWDLIARTATTVECREMRWPTALPVFVQLCTGYAANDIPVGCWTIVLPGDRVLLTERCRRAAESKLSAAC